MKSNIMSQPKEYFPKMGRCLTCGRFIRRGFVNWMNHVYGDCPHAKQNNDFKDRVIDHYLLFGRITINDIDGIRDEIYLQS